MEENNTNQDLSFSDIINNLENAISNVRGNLSTQFHNIRNYGIIIFIFAVLIVLHYSAILTLPVWLIVIIWIIVAFFTFALLGTDANTAKMKEEITKYESLKKTYLSFFKVGKEDTHFDSLVKINIENLADYYTLVKVHTTQSFKLSSLMGSLGFLFILASILISYFNPNFIKISYISAVSGILLEFISGVFFYLYNKTVRQLKSYHDSLLDVQNILLSFKLIEDTKDEKEKSSMIQKMIEFLVGKRTVIK